MGRAGVRKRKPNRHLPKVSGDFDMRAFAPEHSPNTVEGRIEAIGRMARGVRTMSNAQRRFLRRLIAATITALVAVGLADWLLGRIFG